MSKRKPVPPVRLYETTIVGRLETLEQVQGLLLVAWGVCIGALLWSLFEFTEGG